LTSAADQLRALRTPRALRALRALLPGVLAAFTGAAAVAASGAPPRAAAESAESAFAGGLALFEEARSHARESPADRDEIARRYRAAAQSFVAAWEAGGPSAEVFTNAANSFYFAGDIGEAVLFYRRALAVDPAARGAEESLAHLRQGLPVRRPAGGAGASLVRSLFFWHGSISFHTRRAAFLALFPAAFALLAVSLWRRRPFRLLGLLLLAASLAPLGSLLADAFGGSLEREAVVLVDVEGRNGDGFSYTASHPRPFPPGTEVTVLEVRGSSPAGAAADNGWARVRLLDGSESWIPERAVERVLARGV
jgi:tetratricopeptide (TPR) repeat protein